MKEKKMKRFLVDVHTDMHRNAKKAAADEGISLSQYIIGAVSARLAQDKQNRESNE